jgi:hypothetical protein
MGGSWHKPDSREKLNYKIGTFEFEIKSNCKNNTTIYSWFILSNSINNGMGLSVCRISGLSLRACLLPIFDLAPHIIIYKFISLFD